MKRYIRSDATEEYQGIDVEPGIISKTPAGDGPYGELEHKKYRGLYIRDFRNGWLGEDNIDKAKPLFDLALEVFDILKSELGPETKPAFFNLYGDDDDTGIALALDFVPNISDFDRYYDDRGNGTKHARLMIDFAPNGEYSSYPDPRYRSSARGKSKDPKVIAQDILDCLRGFEAWEAKAYAARQKRAATKQNKLKQLKNSEEAVNDTTLSVPVVVDVDDWREKYEYGPVPGNSEIIDTLQGELASAGLLADINKYIKEIRVGFMSSAVTICLYPKVRYQRFRVDHPGKTTSTQFNGACRDAARRAPTWFAQLKAKVAD